MTAPIQYGTRAAPDPTAVMGRRTLAWIADLALYTAVVAAGFASMAEYTDIPAGVADDDACELLEQQNGDLPGGCIAADGTVYLLDTSEAGVQTLLSVGWFAFFVILQGVTGGSPGKLLFGLRVVDQYGNRCGMGRSLGRTLMWVVDAAPWLVPLVGPITAFTSTGHRRVGDLAAGTYVVTSSALGAPVVPGSASPPPGQSAWGAPPPGWGAAAPTPPTAPPGSTGWSSPSTTPAAPTAASDEDWSRPPETPTVPEPEAAPFAAPGAATAPTPSPPAPPAAPSYELPPPQWDPARGTFLQWEPNQQAWLQWDAAGQRWKPIDT